jgi:hypothetical protein
MEKMSKIESLTVEIQKSDENIFNFISDFTNFKDLMPTAVNDLKITADTCSFSLQGMPTIHLKINERHPYQKVSMVSDGGKLPFSLNCIINKLSENSCTAQFYFEAELNSMMKMMVQKPLENFLNVLATKLKDIS